ncbi:MAG: hypothetical protein COV66_02340 [Nitrospinae bacterium CG11_big_fil_rev_8_21_14_0_20_45_15]|nr:MAG: hypothetical protein COV66_02340 [Nitrospinae bacterium CG11_big_fil_rev_8_21_14_0_20_45_15]
MRTNAVSEFKDAIRSAGLKPPNFIEPGKLHRFPGAGKDKDNTAGWCRLFDDQQGGCFGDWSTGLEEHWQATRTKPFTQKEKDAFNRRITEARAQVNAEKDLEQTQANQKAIKIWELAAPVESRHPYLVRKRIGAHNTRTYKGDLLIPIYQGDTLSSLQFITSEGNKRFLTGGCISGGFFIIGSTHNAKKYCVAEGFATGATIHEATRLPVAVAFNAGNLKSVAVNLQEYYGNPEIILCADDDAKTEGNPGLTKARKAAQAVNGLVAIPDFGDNRPDGATDFNDMAVQYGLEKVKDTVERAYPSEPVLSQPECPGSKVQWPEPLADQAFHGLAGEIVKAIEPHTEADPAALLIQLFVAFGSIVGRNPFFKVEADRHGMNLFSCLVGSTSKGRKGTSKGHVMNLFKSISEEWVSECNHSGLSSGEGLIWIARDPIEKRSPVRQKGKIIDYENEIVDQGITDKRILVWETEFANTLQVLKREANTLSPVVRNAWDGLDLRIMTKNNSAKASEPHISIMGHVTKDELQRHLDTTECANGFANRFLWLCVKRSNILPEGGRICEVDFAPMVKQLAEAVKFAQEAGEIKRDEEARAIWIGIYEELSEGKPGLLGSVIARAEAQVMRLSCIYALLDRSSIVKAEHLMAALALWEYCDASARFVFGDSLGDPVADEIKRALDYKPEGMTRTEISNLFKRNKASDQIGRALNVLAEAGLAHCSTESSGGGRPTELWFSMKHSTKKTN